MSAVDIAAQYYAAETAAGRKVTGKQLAEHVGMSLSWGAQTLRKLKQPESAEVHDHTPAAEDVVAPVEATPTVAFVPEAAVQSAESTFGTRLVVWCAFLLGLGASVAANVAAAGHGIGPKIAAGFAPVALLLAIEVIARMRKDGKGAWWLYLGTGVIAAVTAVVSYGHMRRLLLEYGEAELSATILPLAPDGLILVACVALMMLSKRGES